jgi:crotonobetainyl-CoA:carnitine CoA-transferase CaiB-like acyl-CoA transferase
LAGTRVLDLSRILSGPYATMILGDLGADIIKVEHPRGDDVRAIPPLRGGESHYFLSVNRNKRSIVIDLKTDRGRQAVVDLARHCDVVVENFRPGVAAALGLDYQRLSTVNPALVYCSISGFGQSGPWARRTAFDVVVQALSGAMSVTGEADGPPLRLGLPVADLSAGLYGAIGVLAGLAHRHRTGEGLYVDVGMLDSTVGLLGYLAGRYFLTGENPPKAGNGHQSLVPYGTFKARDGYLVVATVTESVWPRLCQALELPELASDERYDRGSKRLERRDEVNALVAAALARQDVDEWCRRFTAADVPHAPILSVEQALAHEQVRARRMVRQVDHPALGEMSVPGPVIKFPGLGEPDIDPPPVLGADTAAVLVKVAGYSLADVRALEAAGIIRGSAEPG